MPSEEIIGGWRQITMAVIYDYTTVHKRAGKV